MAHLPDDQPLGLITELFDMFGLNHAHGYKLARAGKLCVPVIKMGRRMFYSRPALAEVLSAQHPVQSSGAQAEPGTTEDVRYQDILRAIKADDPQ